MSGKRKKILLLTLFVKHGAKEVWAKNVGNRAKAKSLGRESGRGRRKTSFARVFLQPYKTKKNPRGKPMMTKK